jgi:hypothetical protein
MPRTYGSKLLVKLKEGDSSLLGVQLGRLCVEANLPVAYVAEALEVSRNTVHLWFRGQVMNETKRKVVGAFMYLVEEDMKNGVLPAINIKHAKSYIEGMIGKSV